ncbi:MAG: DUF1810 domain-containing protein [Pseudomonadota bacterium]
MAERRGLQAFVDAQEAGVHERALAELRQGKKDSHWMWFVFPQLRGLGRSGRARFYGLEGRVEAEAYLAHPVLGARLLACAAAVLPWSDRGALAVMGSPDDAKLRSSMTLFAEAAVDPAPFRAVLNGFYDGQPDEATLALLRRDR